MRKQKLRNRTILYCVLAIAIVTAVIAEARIKDDEQAAITASCADAYTRLRAETFTAIEPHIGAKAFYVYDFTNNTELDAHDANTALPLASLTKLMTARLVLASVSTQRLYTITPNDLTSEASIGFVPGDEYSVDALLKAALIDSSNNAAVMLAHSTGLSIPDFVTAMNTEAKSLGLASLRYQSVTGLDIENDTIATAFGSAQDILMLLEKDYADYPAVMAYGSHMTETIYSSTGKSIPLVNTDKAISALSLLVAGKTGYTDVAGGNLAVLWKDSTGRLLGASVLGSTEDGRFADMVRLHNTADIFVSSSDSLAKICPNTQ